MSLEQIIEPYVLGAAHFGRIDEPAKTHAATFLECFKAVPSGAWSFPNHFDRVQYDIGADQGCVGPDCVPSHNHHIHPDREVPHATEDCGVAPRWNAPEEVTTLCVGERAVRRSIEEDLNPRERSAAGILADNAGHGALGSGLRCQADQ